MDVKGLLNQFLSSGPASALAEQGKQILTKARQSSTENKSGNSQLADLGKGAAAGSAITMLLSSKKGRKLGGKVLAVGGTIGLGAIAYKAYQSWQKDKEGRNVAPVKTESYFLTHTVADDDTVILQAMIAAAKADGHIDNEEKAKIQEAVQALGADSELEGFVQSELNKPLDPADIARVAKTPEVRAQVYLASLLVADEQNFMEKAYLQELARQLDLEPLLVKELEAQVSDA